MNTEGGMARRRWVPWLPLWLLPPLSTLLLISLFDLLIGNLFELGLYQSGLLVEWLLGTAIAYWLYALLRPWWLFLAVQTLFIGTLYLANGFKVSFFMAPVLPTDFQALPALFDQTKGWMLAAMVAPLLALALGFVAGLRWRWQTPLLLGEDVKL